MPENEGVDVDGLVDEIISRITEFTDAVADIQAAVEKVSEITNKAIGSIETTQAKASGMIESDKERAVARIAAEKEAAIRAIQDAKPFSSADSPSLKQPGDEGYSSDRQRQPE